MKKIFLALAVLAVVAPALPQARADVSIDLFYNNLSGGNWIEVEGYGYGWQPNLALSDPNWRPYADGYWAYTDYGWTWISYEDFGWATYHYGRWANMADYGWVWFPGSDLDWGPAWVSWRTGGDYVGWAPLPPRGPGIVYEGEPIGGRVDIEFDIGPLYYNFVDVRFIGEPVLRDRLFPVSQNVTYITNTVNVTNITVQNNVVYNYGPDYNRLSSYSSRPIQRLKIERQPSADVSAAVNTGTLTKVQGDKLVVAAPQKINKAPAGAPPPKVKAKVAQPKIEKGWAGVSNKAQLEEKIKTENPKNIPPPTGAAAKGPAAGEASPGATPPAAAGGPVASPGAAGAPPERGKGRGRAGREDQAGATAAPGAAQSPVAPGTARERGKRGRPGEAGKPSESPTGAASPGVEGTPPGRERGRPGRERLEASPSPREAAERPGRERRRPEHGETSPGPEQPGGTANAPERTRPGRERSQTSPSPNEQPGAGPGTPETGQPRSRERRRPERGAASPSPEQPSGGEANAPERGRHTGRQPGQAATPSGESNAAASSGAATGETRTARQRGKGAATQSGEAAGEGSAAEPGQGKAERGKKRGEKTSPTPGQQ
jgi:uncharacterized protein DUF6600